MAAAEMTDVHQPVQSLGYARVGRMRLRKGQHLVPDIDCAEGSWRRRLTVWVIGLEEEGALVRRLVGSGANELRHG